jgi:potassium-dependent mechanosensitive channel
MAGQAAAIAVVLTFAIAQEAPAQEPLMLPPAAAAGPATPRTDPADGIDTLKATLSEIQGGFREAHSEDALMALKGRLSPLRDQVNERIGKLEPRLKAIDQRIGQLSHPPSGNAAEDPAIVAERQRLATRRTELEGALQQAKLLADQTSNFDERIRRRRREVFNSRLFARSPSLFDPGFWNDLATSVPAELKGLAVMVSAWGNYARTNGGLGGAVTALALLAVVAAVRRLLARWRRRLTSGPAQRRVDKALAALVNLAASAVIMPATIAAAVLILRNFGLISESVAEIGIALATATAVAGFGRGVALGLFAPAEPDRRIVALGDQEAASYASHLTWASRFAGLSVLANEAHRILGAPVAPFVATSELLAFAILAIAVHLFWRTAQAKFRSGQNPDQNEGPDAPRGWLRVILGLGGITIAVGLATGYVGFAVFVASRLLAAFALSGAVVILITAIDAALTDLLAAGTPGGRRTAAVFGLTSRGLDLIATLASALLRLVVVALAALLALNASGIFTDDLFSAMQRAVSDYHVGRINVSPVAILSALACLVIGGLAVRAAQRWLTVKLLPRTGLESGLQNSIVALSGYFAVIVVMAVSLGILGIDLQKIALIAGALSVGIGFGLQSVVSNFVSGLILLAERSIRVGDWVVVKNEEGFVRRISIRSTEIETFDRASVIIPNQDFITGVVKNITHSNTVGRVVVKVRVAYDSDVTRVRELLLEAAVKNPKVLPGTPAVYLMGLGDIGIDFELMCLTGNIAQGLTVRGELYMDILGRFRDARIKIPYPIHDANVPNLPAPPQATSRIA